VERLCRPERDEVSMTDADRIAMGAALEALIERKAEEAVRRILAEQDSARAPEVLTVAEAARAAGYTQTEPVLRAIRKGTLRASRPPGGRAWRIRADDLEAFLAGEQSRGSPGVLPADPIDLTAHRLATSIQRGRK
jgi:excisionase family DNA binding protein